MLHQSLLFSDTYTNDYLQSLLEKKTSHEKMTWRKEMELWKSQSKCCFSKDLKGFYYHLTKWCDFDVGSGVSYAPAN
jgi:hypothetical protein